MKASIISMLDSSLKKTKLNFQEHLKSTKVVNFSPKVNTRYISRYYTLSIYNILSEVQFIYSPNNGEHEI